MDSRGTFPFYGLFLFLPWAPAGGRPSDSVRRPKDVRADGRLYGRLYGRPYGRPSDVRTDVHTDVHTDVRRDFDDVAKSKNL